MSKTPYVPRFKDAEEAAQVCIPELSEETQEELRIMALRLADNLYRYKQDVHAEFLRMTGKEPSKVTATGLGETGAYEIICALLRTGYLPTSGKYVKRARRLRTKYERAWQMKEWGLI